MLIDVDVDRRNRRLRNNLSCVLINPGINDNANELFRWMIPRENKRVALWVLLVLPEVSAFRVALITVTLIIVLPRLAESR